VRRPASASRSTLEAKNNGAVKFVDLRHVEGRGGTAIAMNRSGLGVILDEKGREKERYHVVYGARLRVKDGDMVNQGQILAEWDPFTFSILTETAGSVKFDDLRPGLTIEEQVDEVTGLSQLVVTLPPGDEKHQPAILVRDSSGKVRKKYLMPSRAHLMVQDGDEVQAGDVLAKIPRETTKTKDITGGLPRVVELFEPASPRIPPSSAKSTALSATAKSPRACAQSTSKAKMARRPRNTPSRAAFTSTFRKASMSAPVKPLIDGPLNLHDLLAVLGEKYTQAYLVNAIQEVYRLQGVNINDKHIETISRQMMRWVKVEDVGDTTFLLEEQIDKFRFREENDRIIAEGGVPQPAVRCSLVSPRRRSRPTRSSLRASFRRPPASSPKRRSPARSIICAAGRKNVIMAASFPPARVSNTTAACSCDRSSGSGGCRRTPRSRRLWPAPRTQPASTSSAAKTTTLTQPRPRRPGLNPVA